jgi:hypothetical protein
MKTREHFFVIALLSLLLLGCDKPVADMESARSSPQLNNDDKQLFLEKPNPALGLTAQFYGSIIELGGKQPQPYQDISQIVIKDNRSGETASYIVENKELDFYFTDIWSPSGNYLVLPIGKKEGFAIFNAKTAISDVEVRKYADTLAVARITELPNDRSKKFGADSLKRNYWHTFVAWEGPSSFRFKGEMEGDTFQFVYDITTRQLSCFDPGCAAADTARNIKGNITLQEKAK